MRLRVGDIALASASVGVVLGFLLTTIWLGLPIPSPHAPGFAPGPNQILRGNDVPGPTRETPSLAERTSGPAHPGWGTDCPTYDGPLAPTNPPGPAPGSRGPVTFGVFQVSIDASARVADVNVPIHLQAVGSGGVPPYKFAWNDSLGSYWGGPTYSLVSSAPSNVTVTLVGVDDLGEVTNVSLRVRFVPTPEVLVEDVPAAVDVGRSFEANLTVLGGVVPEHLAWSIADGSNGSTTLCTNASVPAILISNRTGPVLLSLNGTDADGLRFESDVTVAAAYSMPTLVARVAPTALDAAVPFETQISVAGGAPPRSWSLVSTLPVAAATGTSGPVPANGRFNWSARFLASENGTLGLTIRDAVGSIAETNISVNVSPELALGLSASTSAAIVGGNITLNATIGGGQPPYAFAFLIDGVPLANGTLDVAGRASWNFSPTAAGEFDVSVRAADSAGATATSSVTVVGMLAIDSKNSTADPTGPAGLPATSSWVAWAVGLGLFGVVGAFLVRSRWRRRKPEEDEEDSDAPAVIRRLLEEGGGIDREALYYRAEAEGLSRSAVAAATDRFRREGRLTTRPGLDGEELLGWTNASASTPPAEEER